MRKATLLSLIVVITVGMSLPASATIMSGVTMTAGWWTEDGLQLVDVDSSVGTMTPNGENIVIWEGMMSANGWELGWMFDLDTDPGIAANFSVTNVTEMPQMFFLSIALPVSLSVPAGSFMSGGSQLTVADADFSGSALLSTAMAPTAMPVYMALNDGLAQKTLFDPSYSLLASGAPGITENDGANYTEETTTDPLITTIGIQHVFMLSAGDRATVNSTYFTIPEPVTLSLFAMAGLVLARRKNR